MNYRTERLPLVTFTLIGINTLVWLVSLICEIATQGDSQLWVVTHLWLIPAQSYFWTYLTSMFVHAGIFHLLGNMLFLFLFGSCVEDMIGRLRFLIFYLVAGLVAEIAFIAMIPEHFSSEIPMGGASGAIMGCQGMYLLLRANAEIEFKYFIWLFVYVRAGEFEIPAWGAIIFYFATNLLWAVVGMFSQHHGGGVAFGAHVGGFLGGLALMAIYTWRIRSREEPEIQPGLVLDPAKVLGISTLRPQPVAATSETPTIFLYDGSGQTGPFTLTQVQTGLRDGSIRPEQQYWSEGMEQWQNVTELSATPM
ncbi:MAG TPA: rhomboid family intramembrane serine protease [Candidatus Acidoferrum sp.]|nr:rhomboid family intramembrane serine protease [Candidatus Acidoferrum sp.]